MDTPVVNISMDMPDRDMYLSENFITPILQDGTKLVPNTPYRFRCGILGLCMSGECRLSVNLREYILQEHDFMFIGPGCVVQFHAKSENFRTHSICFSTAYISRSSFRTAVPFFSRVIENPQLHLSDEESALFLTYFQLLQKQNCSKAGRNEETVQHLLSALLSEIADIYRERKPIMERNLSRNEILVRDLIRLILTHFKEHRSVRFYAEQMCITPKYLSTTIKKNSGLTVSEWIDRAVIFEAKIQLKSTSKTVQQVSDYLNFPNPSFFGRYFKRHTGMTPNEYKCL